MQTLPHNSALEQPLHTGIMLIDAAIPIGRGQLELIIGDRNTGKTALVLDIVAAQRPGRWFACMWPSGNRSRAL